MENFELCDEGFADDGMPFICHKGCLRDSKGDIWRVSYTIGGREFVITRALGAWYLDDLAINHRPGTMYGVRRYSSLHRAFNGLKAARLRIFGKNLKHA